MTTRPRVPQQCYDEIDADSVNTVDHTAETAEFSELRVQTSSKHQYTCTVSACVGSALDHGTLQ